jgi:hypothetical protein
MTEPIFRGALMLCPECQGTDFQLHKDRTVECSTCLLPIEGMKWGKPKKK